MKITSLIINNFGPFEGTQNIDFSISEKQPITIIHANNGSGKTTLLNSFLWVLFGGYHVKKKEIPNHHYVNSINEGKELRVFVEMKFSHNKNKYTIRRIAKFKKISNIDVDFISDNVSIVYIDENGGSQSPNNVETYIDQNILPEALKNFFFFHGEDAKDLTLPEKVSSAIKNIMGITLLERAEKHLLKAKNHFTKQIDNNAQSNLKEVNSEIDTIDSSISEKKNLISNNEKLISSNKSQKRDIEDKLVGNELTENFQTLLNQHKIEKETLLVKCKLLNESNRNLVSNSSYLLFINDAIKGNLKILKDKRKKGEIPGKIRRILLKDLIEIGQCLCGEDITPKMLKVLNEKKDAAVSQKFENRVAELSNQLMIMAERSGSISINFDSNATNILEHQTRIDELNELVSDLEAKLDGDEFESVADLRTRIKEIEDENEDALVKNTRMSEEISVLSAGILKDLKEKRTVLIKQDSKQELFKIREDVAEAASHYYNDLLNKINDKVRKELTTLFSTTYNNIMISDFEVNINPSFQVEIRKRIDGRIPTESEGQKRVKSLSFISSLISLAKGYFNSNNNFLKGGIFPLVIDSPFGELDPNYQSMISKNIGELAEQVILFVSPSQWTDSVRRELEGNVGKQVTLKYYTTKSREEFLQGNEELQLVGGTEFNSQREKSVII